jgi:WD40 repeat protein
MIVPNAYFERIKLYINFLFEHPRTMIMVPIMVAFFLSYDVLYDVSIKRLNFELELLFDQCEPAASLPDLARLSNALASLDWSQQYTMAKVTIQPGPSAPLLLSSSFLLRLASYQNGLLNHTNVASIISPLSFWPVVEVNSTASHCHPESLLRHINSKAPMQLASFFLKDIDRVDNLVQHVRALNIYVIYADAADDMFSAATLQQPLGDALVAVESTTRQASIKDFVRYIAREAARDTYYPVLYSLMAKSIILITSIVFVAYLALCIMNQSQIRSKLGLVLGWSVEVVLAACGGVSIMSLLHDKCWNVMYEPSTVLTRFLYVFLLLLMSSNSMLNMINYLSGKSGVYEGHKLLRIRIYKMLVGVDPVARKPARHERINPGLSSVPLQVLAACRKVCVLPLTVRCLVVNFAVLTILKSVSVSLVRRTYGGATGDYFASRISNYIGALRYGIVLDQILQLTYLLSIIVIDVKRLELTDILALNSPYGSEHADDYLALNEELLGVNYFLSILLKLLLPPRLRPTRSSVRHKLGQYLLRFKNPAPLCARLGFNTLVEAAFLLATFGSWAVSIPHSLLDDDIAIYEEMNVVSARYDVFYYLELLLIMFIIVGVAGITFKFAYSEIDEKQHTTVLTNSDEPKTLGKAKDTRMASTNSSASSLFEYEYESVKHFKLIDMLKVGGGGHTLDVLKIRTNLSSPFIVTIGLDHQVLIWSPLSKPEIPKPINILSIDSASGREFWPINHVNISSDGNNTVLINYRLKTAKCFERSQLKFVWETSLVKAGILPPNGSMKILESFFRRRTVPGYLTRKIQQQKRQQRKASGTDGHSRRSSVSSTSSSLNGNFQAPLVRDAPGRGSATLGMAGVPEGQVNSALAATVQDALAPKTDFIFVLETGVIITISCTDGSVKQTSLLEAVYPGDIGNSLVVTSAKRLTTPRINDRIICHLNNYDIVVATLVNNKFSIKRLDIQMGFYNKGLRFVAPLMALTSSQSSNRFSSICEDRLCYKAASALDDDASNGSTLASTLVLNTSTIAPVSFVGMVVRVRNLCAELIDVQTGIVLKTFSIGHFKPHTFKVSHLEPTHCKFCGCASIKSFSLMYQDNHLSTLMMHTYKIDTKKSKNNICLRVERDPREIRCLGFNAVTEHQYWFDNVETWQVTDINMIIGTQRRDGSSSVVGSDDGDDVVDAEDLARGQNRQFSALVEDSGLSSLRSRTKGKLREKRSIFGATKPIEPPSPPHELSDIWQGFIITCSDGKFLEYSLPTSQVSDLALSISRPLCIEKFGYKSVVLSFGNLIKILYLGSNKLIEKDLYYSGSNTGLESAFPTEENGTGTASSGLLFIDKRRNRERGLRRSQ